MNKTVKPLIERVERVKREIESVERELDNWDKSFKFSVLESVDSIQVQHESTGYGNVSLHYMPFNELKESYIHVLRKTHDRLFREFRKAVLELNNHLNPKPNPNESQK